MKQLMTILFIMLSMIACNGAEKSQTKATANEYKFVDIDTLPEKYVEKFLYTIKWGEGENELTLKNGEGPYICRMNNEEELYMLDIFPGKIKKYDKNGVLIGTIRRKSLGGYNGLFISGGNLFLRGINNISNIIIIIDEKTGELKDSIILSKINIINENEYFLNKRYILLNNKKEIIFDTGPTMGDSIGEMELEVKLNKRMMRIGNLISESKGEVDMRGIEITLPKQFDPTNKTAIAENMIFVRYLGRDINKNLYFYANLQKPEGGGGHENYVNYVIKYNSEGKLVSIVTVRNGKIDYVPQIHYVDIMPDGAIYSVMPYEEGVRVYKYEVKR
ncbi:MAG: hypothetical protein PHW02_01975 [bacterium]|nr:hypothetical protein [bacterium]